VTVSSSSSSVSDDQISRWAPSWRPTLPTWGKLPRFRRHGAPRLARLHGGLGGSGSAASLVGAVRAADFGVAARLGYGTAGRMGGAQLRWYPPLPLPVASYVATGIDASPGTIAWHLALGAQVAVNERLRLELEGGVARSSTIRGPVWASYASLGVSYCLPDHAGSPGRPHG
jgi:hypothetical protein